MSLRAFLKHPMSAPNHFGGLIVALLLAGLYSYYLFPQNFVSGTSTYWLAQNEDITTYIAGFNAFFREPWHWPLLRIDSINWPAGTLATFVDIIPLYSSLLKAFAPQHWFAFNPFGAWILLCMGLQALGAWWILREAQMNNWITLMVLTVFLLTLPSWNNRFGHLSLFAHWILLFSLALVLREIRTQRFPNWPWFILLICTFFINLYLLAMIALIYLSRLVPQLFTQAHRTKLLVQLLCMLTIFVIALAMMMWPLPPATGGVEFGFGVYSLNLLGPISGGQFLHFTPDSFSPEQSSEGLNYLGLGLLLLLAISMLWPFMPGQNKHVLPKPVWPKSLWWLLLFFFLYALSNQIYWGADQIFQWRIPPWAKSITGQFRASGRFFWPIGYALAIFAVIRINQLYSPRIAQALLCIALFIQLADLQPILKRSQDHLNRSSAPILDQQKWQDFITPTTKTLYIYPKLKCNQHASFLDNQLPFMLFASIEQLNINTGYIARHNPGCSKEASEIAQSDFSSSAYLFINAEYTDAKIQSLLPANGQHTCQKIQAVTLCTLMK
jgi:hypothetical protein